ncbi:endolytic transglycosylase MltG [Pontimonas sp.]|nr:endolytic transglycosylase MltG [Pontimonas sp.]
MPDDSKFDEIFNTLPGERKPAVPEDLPSRRETLRSAPGGRGKTVFALFAIVILLLSGGGVWWVWSEYGERVVNYFASEPVADYEGGGAAPTIDVIVSPGDIGETVARKLADVGVTASFEAVYDLLLQDATITFQPGTYRLLTGMSAESALSALRDSGNRVQVSFVIPEGVTMQRALEIIAEQASVPLEDLADAVSEPSLYAVSSPAGSLEGYLFPATYSFEPGVSAEEIVGRMVEETKTRLTQAGVAESDWHRVLTMAGLIQREARLEEDFYKAARVFYNRLDVGMALQSDATVTYWTGLYDGVGTSDADRADESNPYNTYVFPGLPPGPISLPGDIAIDAAVNPAVGDWLYFVSIDLRTGETVFSNTYAQHLVAVDQWLSWCRESEENGAYC